MWPYRRKSTTNDTNNDDCSPTFRRTPSSPNFKHRSFKDIETLTQDDDTLSNFTTIDEEEPASSSSQNRPTTADVVKRATVFHRVHLANRFTRAFAGRTRQEPNEASSESTQLTQLTQLNKSGDPPSEKPLKLRPRVTIPGSGKRVVVYMTSLRAVRSTFEACRTVRSILQGFRVPIDERDLLMDSSFFDEIRKIMAQIGQGRRDDKRVSLPKVFIRGRYIGGADEIVELHEIGELKKFMAGLPAAAAGVCEICGGFRFILCDECSGSHKCPLEDGGFRTCTLCNENGLIRCPSCLSC